MLANSDMKANRFAHWAFHRKALRDIQACLAAGGEVHARTYLRITVYKAKHADMFKATKIGLSVRCGKSGWNRLIEHGIMVNALDFYRPVAKKTRKTTAA